MIKKYLERRSASIEDHCNCKVMNTQKIEEHIKAILIEIGEDPNREGLIDTPRRVAKMFQEIYQGIQYSNDDIAEMFNKTFEHNSENAENDIVVVNNIDIFSHCEHHMALMYNMKVSVAYLPQGRIIGLSKIARIADMVGRRLQVQERIGTDIAYIIQKITNSEDVAVIVEGEHACMTIRGIKKNNTKTVTTVFRGRFAKDKELKNQVLLLFNKQ